MLVGRARELSALERSVSAATAGHGSLVLVGGEPGIGKTSLVAEVARRASTRGVVTGWGVSPAAGASPFLPWRSALRGTCEAGVRRLDRADGGGEDARFRLFEDVVDDLVTVSTDVRRPPGPARHAPRAVADRARGPPPARARHW